MAVAGEERKAMVGSGFPKPITAELDDVTKSRFALAKSFGGRRQLRGLAVAPAELNGKGSTTDDKANHRAKDANHDDGRLVAPNTRFAVQIPHRNAGSGDDDRGRDSASENKHPPDIGETVAPIS